jgi:uncharacterized membrane protein
LLAGIVVIAPVGVTAHVLWWILTRLDAILGQVLLRAGLRVLGLGLAALIVLLLITGWLAQLAAGRELVHVGRQWLRRFPLTRSIYGVVSQVVEQVVGENRRLFKSCVLVEYPRSGSWAVGFLMSPGPAEIDQAGARRRSPYSCRPRRTRPRGSFSSCRASR